MKHGNNEDPDYVARNNSKKKDGELVLASVKDKRKGKRY